MSSDRRAHAAWTNTSLGIVVLASLHPAQQRNLRRTPERLSPHPPARYSQLVRPVLEAAPRRPEQADVAPEFVELVEALSAQWQAERSRAVFGRQQPESCSRLVSHSEERRLS